MNGDGVRGCRHRVPIARRVRPPRDRRPALVVGHVDLHDAQAHHPEPRRVARGRAQRLSRAHGQDPKGTPRAHEGRTRRAEAVRGADAVTRRGRRVRHGRGDQHRPAVLPRVQDPADRTVPRGGVVRRHRRLLRSEIRRARMPRAARHAR